MLPSKNGERILLLPPFFRYSLLLDVKPLLLDQKRGIQIERV